MAFVGRDRLVSVVDDMVRPAELVVGREPQTNPILVVHGCGGSGRTELLRQVHERWSVHTPVALVTPTRLAMATAAAPRPLLSAVWQGLVGQVRFPRLTLAHIAMADPPLPDPPAATPQIRHRVNGDGGQTLVVLENALAAAGTAAAGARGQDPANLEPYIKDMARQMVNGLRGRLLSRRLKLDNALVWFARHGGNPNAPDAGELALIQLNQWARANDAAGLAGIDDLLVGALLADLTETAAEQPKRVANPVLLIDGADRADVGSFLGAVLRARALADAPDPLTIVATSGGSLAGTLHSVNQFGRRTGTTEEARAELSGVDGGAPPPWVSVPLSALSWTDTGHLVGTNWADGVSQVRAVDAVHRAAAGHPAATVAAVDRLRRAGKAERRGLVDAPRALLPTGDALLNRMIEGLSSTVADECDVLITLSAARNLAEASRLVRGPQRRLAPVATLWTASGEPERPAPATLLRLFLLERLATRPPGPRADRVWDWSSVHRHLRDSAPADDHVGKLHHRLALGEVDAVSAELERMRPLLGGNAWLAMLDEVVAVPDLKPPPGTPSLIEQTPCLVTRLQRLGDLRTSREERVRLYLKLADDYTDASQTATSDHQAFFDRAEDAVRRATALR